ncbi:hypothetical protein D777_02112 [Marinobacter nitratireducens]|uniref:DUF4123 domain-containing protein n=1 Tax=Marinobacter nitratireducens TaxID=1137280 RepID=A0A072MZV1_9GAMM|nr:DUF4123 domain-containing protein [Marinobacter nitratireducens]KEF30959.1 hypothetical protein D777_02112 [Marinobacter nitratireducens]
MSIIESIPQQTEAPEQTDFAILDLAQKDEGQLLGWLYSHVDQREIPWASLYQGTALANHWTTGPILIELREAPAFHQALIERYQSECLGMLISAPDVSLETMADHLRLRAIVEKDGKPSVFRYYDPRSLGPLFAVLEPLQQQQLIGPGSQWLWYHHGQWQQASSSRQDGEFSENKSFVISAEQLARMDQARSHLFALSLAHNYRGYIPSDDADSFVLSEVKAAQELGLATQADQDRWLRMAIKVQGPLQESSQWRQLAQGTDQTPLQILSQLECEQGR